MSKTKNKNHDEVRFLQGEIRRLNKLVRSLEKENRSLKKWEHTHDPEGQDDKDVVLDSEDTFVKRGVPCENCGKGFYKEFEIAGKVFGTCNVCESRKKLK